MKNLIKCVDILLNEEVNSGNMITFYHRTGSGGQSKSNVHMVQNEEDALIKSFLEHDFCAGKGEMYGNGIYGYLDLKSALTSPKRFDYGQYILKCMVKPKRIIFFDLEDYQKYYSTMSLKDYDFIEQQIEELGVGIDSMKFENFKISNMTSGDVALMFVRELNKIVKVKKRFESVLDAITYTGRSDHHAIVVYKPEMITAISYNYGFDELEFPKWKSITIQYKDIFKGKFLEKSCRNLAHHTDDDIVLDVDSMIDKLKAASTTDGQLHILKKIFSESLPLQYDKVDVLNKIVSLYDDKPMSHDVQDFLIPKVMMTNEIVKLPKFLLDQFDIETKEKFFAKVETEFESKVKTKKDWSILLEYLHTIGRGLSEKLFGLVLKSAWRFNFDTFKMFTKEQQAKLIGKWSAREMIEHFADFDITMPVDIQEVLIDADVTNLEMLIRDLYITPNRHIQNVAFDNDPHQTLKILNDNNIKLKVSKEKLIEQLKMSPSNLNLMKNIGDIPEEFLISMVSSKVSKLNQIIDAGVKLTDNTIEAAMNKDMKRSLYILSKRDVKIPLKFQLMAVKDDPENIKYIKNPHSDVLALL